MGTKQPLKGTHWELLGRQWEEGLLVLGVYKILGTISVVLGTAIRSPFPCGSCGPHNWSASRSRSYSKTGEGGKARDIVKLSLRACDLRSYVLVLCATLCYARDWPRAQLVLWVWLSLIGLSSNKPEPWGY